MLEAAGMTQEEELLYRALLESGKSTSADLADSTGLAPSRISSLMPRLRARGMVTQAGGRPPTYLPVPPVIAIEALVIQEEEELHRRSEELSRLRVAAAELARHVGRPSGPGGASPEFVEVLQGREALGDRFYALQRAARHEVLGFDKPPYVIGSPPTSAESTSVQRQQLERGVKYRIVYDSSALEQEGMLRQLESLREAGEDARVHPRVPMKLAIADRKLGLIPLNLTDPTAASGLIIHESSLLEALVMFFDTMWERAQPFASPFEARASQDLSELERRLVLLLGSGLKDEAIARQLGLGSRTVLRHVSNLLARVEARTRFQAGVQAAKRGWL